MNGICHCLWLTWFIVCLNCVKNRDLNIRFAAMWFSFMRICIYFTRTIAKFVYILNIIWCWNVLHFICCDFCQFECCLYFNCEIEWDCQKWILLCISLNFVNIVHVSIIFHAIFKVHYNRLPSCWIAYFLAQFCLNEHRLLFMISFVIKLLIHFVACLCQRVSCTNSRALSVIITIDLSEISWVVEAILHLIVILKNGWQCIKLQQTNSNDFIRIARIYLCLAQTIIVTLSNYRYFHYEYFAVSRITLSFPTLFSTLKMRNGK